MPLLDRVFLYTVVSTLEAGVVVVVVIVLTGIIFRAFARVGAGVELNTTLLCLEYFYFLVRTLIY
jgi:hypothetical protein